MTDTPTESGESQECPEPASKQDEILMLVDEARLKLEEAMKALSRIDDLVGARPKKKRRAPKALVILLMLLPFVGVITGFILLALYR